MNTSTAGCLFFWQVCGGLPPNNRRTFDQQVVGDFGTIITFRGLLTAGFALAAKSFLMHSVDENGLITFANLIIATVHNNLAMNRGILQAARYFVRSEKLTEGMLNRVEAVIRAFDPCLSCSTHTDGHMALHVRLVGPEGKLLDEM